MKNSWGGILVVIALVGGVLAAKALSPRNASDPMIGVANERPQVLLFANPKEADASCGCGEIFRAVREVSTKGVRTREVDPGRELDLVRQYRVTVEPTVIFVDQAGRELGRREGEAGDTLTQVRGDLDRLVEVRQ